MHPDSELIDSRIAEKSSDGPYATVVWLHPGNFTTGNPAMWSPHYLVFKYKIIVVTVAFRLGFLGFFSTLDGEAPGNYGLMDQQAAMAWVRRNVGLFGGNPRKICLMGYGSGAVSVGLHMVNQQSRSYFDKAIAMSGNFLHPSAVKQPQEDQGLLKKIASLFACYPTPSSLLVRCLRDGEATFMVELASNIISWRPLIDSGLSNSSLPFLTDYPKASFEVGDYHKVPLLTGYADMEEVLNLFAGGDANRSVDELQRMFEELVYREVPSSNVSEPCTTNSEFVADSILFFYTPSEPMNSVQEYRRLLVNFTTERSYASSSLLHAAYLSKYSNAYVYRFDLKPSTVQAMESVPEWVTVPHLYDLIFIWGIPYWGSLPNGQQDWDDRDRKNSETIMNFWTNFMKSDDPTKKITYNIKWEPFSEDDPRVLIINGSFSMSSKDVFNYKALQFWNEYYPKVLNAAQCCNVTEAAHFHAPSGILTTAVLASVQLLML